MCLGGIFNYGELSERLQEVNGELENQSVWNNPQQAQSLGKERLKLDSLVQQLDALDSGLNDIEELLELVAEDQDEQAFLDVQKELETLVQLLEQLEFRRMFSSEVDSLDAYVDIQSGSGGTEAQDWANMLLRMYLRWGEKRGYKAELLEVSSGEVAGIKSATIMFTGEYAFGWLKTETGVHRLVRKSPFDSGSRRHTSFASVYVSPVIDENFEVDICLSDLRIDTYRSSGAGGQHVNTTDSAVRITHEPTGIVVQCQNQRSQHQNKDKALQQLRAKLYDLEMQKRIEKSQVVEDSKADIGWGSQIRSYVLDSSRIKDLRTGVEVHNTQSVLDGDLDVFMEASLKAGL